MQRKYTLVFTLLSAILIGAPLYAAGAPLSFSGHPVPWVKKKAFGDWENPYTLVDTLPAAGRFIRVASTSTLFVSKAGTGTVTGGGIDCGAVCEVTVSRGDTLQLTAVPATGSTFAGWSGACTGSTCSVTLQAREEFVTATFEPIPTYSLNVTNTGNGTVTADSGGIDCGAVCSADYYSGTTVTLTATPDADYAFDTWGGACSGTGTAVCRVDILSAQSVSVNFIGLGTVVGSVFMDDNGNGYQDGEESNLEGVQMTISANATVISTSSGADGTYTLNAVPADASASLSFTCPVDYTATTANPLSVAVPAGGTLDAGAHGCEPPPAFSEVGGTPFPGVYGVDSNIAWGDYDSDGDLDLMLAGIESSGTPVAKLYQNTAGSFSEVYAGTFSGAERGGVNWGDYDNDGNPDLMITGVNDNTVNNWVAKLYQNTGNGFSEAYTDAFIGSAFSNVAWGDYDNDGRTDLVLTNNGDTKLYKNIGGDFTEVHPGMFNGMYVSDMAWIDYDNDSDLDLMLTGDDTGFVATTKLYENTGTGFNEVYVDSFVNVDNSTMAWGDYDNDDDADLMLIGYDSTYTPVAKLYQNTGSGFSEVYAGTFTGVEMGSVAWGDYDNDGDLDLMLTGMSGENVGIITEAKLYQNTGNGFTEVHAGIFTEVYFGSVAWGDYDNDGDLDLMLTGEDNALNVVSKLYRNNTAGINTPPAAPTNLSATVAGNTVTLNWDATGDAETPAAGLTYNLRVGTYPGGGDVLSPLALADGTRQIAAPGFIQGTSWHLADLDWEQSEYYWSVQAVDTALAGSAWAAEGSFSIVPPAAGVLQFTGFVYSASEGDAGATVTVSRIVGNSGTVSVTLTTTDSSAVAGSDYTAVSEVLTWGDGDSSIKTVTIPLRDDGEPEEDIEMVTLNLSQFTGGALPGADEAVLKIHDNETQCRQADLTLADYSTVNDSLTPGQTGTITDLNVRVHLTHFPIGDLVLTLQHQETGTSVTLLDGFCFNTVEEANFTFDDEGSAGVDCEPFSQYVKADIYTLDHMSIFDGEDLSGTWVLSVTDQVEGGNSGTLMEWCLTSTVSISNIPPAMVSPAAPSTLSGSDVTFTWEGSNIQQSWLYAGSAAGRSDYFDSGDLGNATSVDVTGLPVDGGTVYVRLWYYDTQWSYLDYTYTAVTVAPAMLSPADNSTLDRSDVTFTWEGAGVQHWWLYAGSAAGRSDYFDSGDLGTVTSVQAMGLPVDGSTVYVRLWYYNSSTWQFLDYIYTAHSVVPAMTSPVDGSTLSGPDVTFTWEGAGVQQWWLYIGTVAGTKNLFDSGSLTGAVTSANVSGLPQNGSTVHARLWYNDGSGMWKKVDYTYTATTVP